MTNSKIAGLLLLGASFLTAFNVGHALAAEPEKRVCLGSSGRYVTVSIDEPCPGWAVGTCLMEPLP